MRNVWLDLPQTSPYVLEIDRNGLDQYNVKAVGATKINFESIPEPFIGNPETATVVLRISKAGIGVGFGIVRRVAWIKVQPGTAHFQHN